MQHLDGSGAWPSYIQGAWFLKGKQRQIARTVNLAHVDVVRIFCVAGTRKPLRIHLAGDRYIYFYALCDDYLLFSCSEAKMAEVWLCFFICPHTSQQTHFHLIV
jgi:hypothetical protein